MNRLVLFTVLLFQSSLIFCQSTATSPASPQVPGKLSMGQWPFGFSKSPLEQDVTKPTFKSFNCGGGASATSNQVSAPIDFDHLFSAPCADLNSKVEFLARNESFFSRSPLFVGPRSKGEPIPTQWPNAKVEHIPTQWPNLKLQPIDAGSASLAPARGSEK